MWIQHMSAHIQILPRSDHDLVTACMYLVASENMPLERFYTTYTIHVKVKPPTERCCEMLESILCKCVRENVSSGCRTFNGRKRRPLLH